jgi:ubiquinone/menaquinone biosynthesis C-methylase UbiE
MLAAARSAHPDIPFEEGTLDDLPISDGSLAGVVCWYSIIYTPLRHLDRAFLELLRVLDSRGLLFLAFHAGSGEALHRADAFGTTLPLTTYQHRLDDVVHCLAASGFEVHTTVERTPTFAHESTPQAFVIARAM